MARLVTLRYLADMNIEQVAETLAISITTANAGGVLCAPGRLEQVRMWPPRCQLPTMTFDQRSNIPETTSCHLPP